MQVRTKHFATLAAQLLSAGLFLPAVQAQPALTAIHGWTRYVQPVVAEGPGGVCFFPAELAGTRPVEVLDPQGYAVHMTRADDPGEEQVFPAGMAFEAPGGRWRVWLQREWAMTPFSTLVVFPAHWPPSRCTPQLLPLQPAGRVDVADDTELEGDPELWLLYAGSKVSGTREELSRRRSIEDAGDGVLMPAGPVLAGVWDREEEHFTALTRRFSVEGGETISAPLRRPDADTSWIVAHVERSGDSTEGDLEGLKLAIRRDDDVHPPDVTVLTSWGAYGFWYGIEPGAAVLEASNERLYLHRQTLDLNGGEIEWFEGTVAKRPSLEVGLVLPPLLREAPLSLEVRTLPGGDLLAEASLSRDAGRYRFDGLISELVEVVLVTHVGSFRRRVDLANAEEGFVTLSPEVVEVFGTVYYDGGPHPAAVTFQAVDGEEVEALSDEDGSYQAISLQPLRWVTVRLEEVDQEPWRDFFTPALEHSRELDFEIPDAEVTVRVLDKVTGEGIAGAQVAVRNVYVPPEEDYSGELRNRDGRDKALARSHRADDSGVVRLPPPRPGRLELQASADRYRPMQHPVVLEVQDPPQDRDLELMLEPSGEHVPVRLRLPDGSPAAGAEVVRVGSLSADTILFTGRADSSGVVDVPIEPGPGLLLLKHPAAAFGILDWESQRNESEIAWTFPSVAGRPLSLRVLDPAGEEPARGVSLSLWVNGRKLTGRLLRWLLESPPGPDQNGFWVCERLPALGVRVLAWERGVHSQEAAGVLDALATEIRFPWPEMVDVRAVR